MHVTDTYILNPTHRITVALVGIGGTGSQVLAGLARMDQALQGLGHPGLHVTAYDPDAVSESNIGRQLFSPADVGVNKAVLSITRTNRFFGTDWQAVQSRFHSKCEKANITISCVDTVAARVEIAKALKGANSGEPYNWKYYWMDYGNAHSTGQVILGTVNAKSGSVALKNVLDYFPRLSKTKDKDTGPSCSIAQALNKQDLFINSTLANLGLSLLWKIFREGGTQYNGFFLNLKTLQSTGIRIA